MCIDIRMVCAMVVVVAAVGMVTQRPKEDSIPYQPEEAVVVTLASR